MKIFLEKSYEKKEIANCKAIKGLVQKEYIGVVKLLCYIKERELTLDPQFFDEYKEGFFDEYTNFIAELSNSANSQYHYLRMSKNFMEFFKTEVQEVSKNQKRKEVLSLYYLDLCNMSSKIRPRHSGEARRASQGRKRRKEESEESEEEESEEEVKPKKAPKRKKRVERSPKKVPQEASSGQERDKLEVVEKLQKMNLSKFLPDFFREVKWNCSITSIKKEVSCFNKFVGFLGENGVKVIDEQFFDNSQKGLMERYTEELKEMGISKGHSVSCRSIVASFFGFCANKVSSIASDPDRKQNALECKEAMNIQQKGNEEEEEEEEEQEEQDKEEEVYEPPVSRRDRAQKKEEKKRVEEKIAGEEVGGVEGDKQEGGEEVGYSEEEERGVGKLEEEEQEEEEGEQKEEKREPAEEMGVTNERAQKEVQVKMEVQDTQQINEEEEETGREESEEYSYGESVKHTLAPRFAKNRKEASSFTPQRTYVQKPMFNRKQSSYSFPNMPKSVYFPNANNYYSFLPQNNYFLPMSPIPQMPPMSPMPQISMSPMSSMTQMPPMSPISMSSMPQMPPVSPMSPMTSFGMNPFFPVSPQMVLPSAYKAREKVVVSFKTWKEFFRTCGISVENSIKYDKIMYQQEFDLRDWIHLDHNSLEFMKPGERFRVKIMKDKYTNN